MKRLIISFGLALLAGSSARAETVCIKYGSCLDLVPFTCTETAQSSFVYRVCYDGQ
jgi:hypothetical protein